MSPVLPGLPNGAVSRAHIAHLFFRGRVDQDPPRHGRRARVVVGVDAGACPCQQGGPSHPRRPWSMYVRSYVRSVTPTLVRNEVIRRLGERVPRQGLPRKAPWWSRDDPPVGAAAIAGAGGVVRGGIGSSDCRCWVQAAHLLSMAPCPPPSDACFMQQQERY